MALSNAPIAVREAAVIAVSFEECGKQFIEARKPGWKNLKHADQWTSTLEKWAYPVLGKLPVGGVNTDLVMKVLEQRIGEGADAPAFWNARTETANRVRGRIENILDWATARKLRHGDNPARWKGLLDKLLPAPSQVSPTQPHPALPYSQLPEFMVDLRSLKTALTMFSISVAGTTRRPVIVIGAFAFKFARGQKGRASNLYEAHLYKTTTKERRAMLCPVVWVSPKGQLQISRSAKPTKQMMTIEEYLEFDDRWDAMPGEDPSPFEPKANDWGWYDGRLVALDYSLPAWQGTD